MNGRALGGLPNRTPQSCEQRENDRGQGGETVTEAVNRKTLVALALAFGALLLAMFASGTADLTRSDGGHLGLLHVPQL
jgi:hypothetical protein